MGPDAGPPEIMIPVSNADPIVSSRISIVAVPVPAWTTWMLPLSSVSPWIVMVWSAADAAVLAEIVRLPENTGAKLAPARSMSASLNETDSRIGPLVWISTTSPAWAASMHSWSVSLQGADASGHTHRVGGGGPQTIGGQGRASAADAASHVQQLSGRKMRRRELWIPPPISPPLRFPVRGDTCRARSHTSSSQLSGRASTLMPDSVGAIGGEMASPRGLAV